MPSEEKAVKYISTNSYSTRNSLSDTTENIWIVLHGIGYLSRYFLRHFEGLPEDKNYIIAPQAPSKYYLSKAYTHVGASWLTQEETQREIKNVLAYLDAVMARENILVNQGKLPEPREERYARAQKLPATTDEYPLKDEKNLGHDKIPLTGRNVIVLGFSQGVSIATRWVARRQIKCHQLVLYAGGIPNELRPSDFEFLQKNGTQVKILVGDKDEYLNEERRKSESKKIENLFRGTAITTIFEGGHEMRKELVEGLIQ